MIQKRFSSSLRRQSSKTKPRTNFVLVRREPLLCLEFNKPSKQNVSEINLFQKFNFSQCQNNCWHADWSQKWNIKTSLLKIGKLKYITLLSDGNVPVRFRAQQRAKYRWPQLTVNSIAAKMRLWHYISWFENQRRQKSPPSFTLLSFKTRIKWPLGWPQPQVFREYFFNSCNFQGKVQAFGLTGLLRWQRLTWFFQHFLQDL